MSRYTHATHDRWKTLEARSRRLSSAFTNIVPLLCVRAQIGEMEKKRDKKREECNKVLADAVKKPNCDPAMVSKRVSRKEDDIHNAWQYQFCLFLIF